MAFDEAMLVSCADHGRPLLRFYSWKGAAASFGYFQKYKDIESSIATATMIRRCTGGGLVPHVGDWTYSLVFPAGHERHRLPATEGYRRLHESVAAAFRDLGLDARLAQECDGCGPGHCFVGHEVHDVLGVEGKLAGAAQRRTRDGLLIQGSIRPPGELARAEWQAAFARRMGFPAEAIDESAECLARLRGTAERLVVSKYSKVEYLKMR